MACDLFSFEQKVASNGYEWVEAKLVILSREATPEEARTGLYLVPRNMDGLKPKICHPLVNYPCLFQEFVDVGLSKSGISKFAGRYGLLGDRVTSPITHPGDASVVEGESLSAWKREIKIMKRAFDLWHALSEQDVDAALSGVQELMSSYAPYGSEAVTPQIDFLQAYWDATSASKLELINTLSLSWDKKSAFALDLLVNDQLASLARPKITTVHDSESFELTITTYSLLGCLWLQFAHHISGSTKHKRCSQCRTWFLIDNPKSRSTREFCSDACRSKHYRNKRT